MSDEDVLDLERLSGRLRASKRIGVSVTFIRLEELQKLLILAEKVEAFGLAHKNRKADPEGHRAMSEQVARLGRFLLDGEF